MHFHACILGGAEAPASQRIFKQFAREVNAVLPRLEATRPLRWSVCAITFSSADQLKCAATAGVLPMLCSTIISNVVVTRTLIDGGAGLNVLSVETFNNLQVPYNQLQPTKPFSGRCDEYPLVQDTVSYSANSSISVYTLHMFIPVENLTYVVINHQKGGDCKCI